MKSKKSHSHHIWHHLGNAQKRDSHDPLQFSFTKSLQHRLPWLFVGLVGGALTARIVDIFTKTLAEHILLASFIPLITYMGDAVGTQMESFMIRDLAIKHNISFSRYFFHQLGVTSLIGLIAGGLAYAGCLFFFADGSIGLVVGISLYLSIISSILTGLSVPFIFNKFKVDPASASGPIATIAQTILSVTIYFVVARLVL